MIDYQKSLDKVAVLCTCELPDEDREHVLTVIEALKKRIPKAPIANTGAPWWTCPTCGGAVRLHPHSMQTPFCHWCGQAVKWEGVI